MNHMKRAGRKQSIVLAMLIAREAGRTNPFFTQYEIAKKLDLKPSGYLLDVMKEMVRDGLLINIMTKHREGVLKHTFALSRHYKGVKSSDLRVDKRREIVVNSARGQMRLAL